jgi:hypothetical protein
VLHLTQHEADVPHGLPQPAADGDHSEARNVPNNRGQDENPKPVLRSHQSADGGHQFHIAGAHCAQRVHEEIGAEAGRGFQRSRRIRANPTLPLMIRLSVPQKPKYRCASAPSSRIGLRRRYLRHGELSGRFHSWVIPVTRRRLLRDALNRHGLRFRNDTACLLRNNSGSLQAIHCETPPKATRIRGPIRESCKGKLLSAVAIRVRFLKTRQMTIEGQAAAMASANSIQRASQVQKFIPLVFAVTVTFVFSASGRLSSRTAY